MMTSSPTPSRAAWPRRTIPFTGSRAPRPRRRHSSNEEFAMAVIDVGLPGADGLTLVRRLRSAGKTLPTLILTARCTLTDKVKALDLGADDFLSKPFEAAELAARCRALMRRSSGALGRHHQAQSHERRSRRQAAAHRRRRGGAHGAGMAGAGVPGAARRTRSSPRSACSRPWPVRTTTLTPNAVEVHISRLRAKLGTAAVVRSLRGLGYRLEEAKSA